MKYVVLAILMFILGALLTTFKPPEPELIPIVRMRSPQGFFVTYIRDRVSGHQLCKDEVQLYVDSLAKACPECTIESSECTTSLVGMEKALADEQPLPVHVVRSEGINMSVVGPPRLVRTWCETVAAAIVKHGMPTAACVYPQSPG